MKRILYLSVALAALSAAPAIAGDAGQGGWYIGLNAGGTAGEFKTVATAVSPTKWGGNVSGGAQLGYEWPAGGSGYVYGVEADITAIDVRARASFAKFDEDWSSTVRARLGMVYGDCTPFISLGVGFTDFKQTLVGFGSNSSVRTGIAAGVGADLARGDKWTWRVEYLYVDVPKKLSHITGVPFDGGSGNHTVRIAFNYPLD